jgi:hypothetical protein
VPLASGIFLLDPYSIFMNPPQMGKLKQEELGKDHTVGRGSEG